MTVDLSAATHLRLNIAIPNGDRRPSDRDGTSLGWPGGIYQMARNMN